MAETKLRVLVIDDANLVRLYYRRILEAANYDVDEALNGIEAMEKLTHDGERLPDLMIVDVNMPHMDGLTFLAALRKHPLPRSAIPALVTSSEANPRDIAAARAAGANYYLVKPVRDATLLEHVAIMCGRTT